ncbi:hypothetical protein APHAL10511_000011 [Amanita phalloides]|nr:hypothetical protein APHAL10511_000011 [Amanita phalloides]
MSSNSSMHKTLLLFLLFTPFLSVCAVQLGEQVCGDLTFYIGYEDCTSGPFIPDLVDKAKEAMNSLRALEIPKGKEPGAVSALWIARENRCYFATSAKGHGRVIGSPMIPAAVKTALTQCVNDPHPTDAAHRYRARCGEVMVISLWFIDHPGQLRLPKEKLIVTVNADKVFLPCTPKAGEPAVFGCYQFLQAMGFSKAEIIFSSGSSSGRGLGRATPVPVVTTSHRNTIREERNISGVFSSGRTDGTRSEVSIGWWA